MVDAKSSSENLLESRHNLHGKCNLRKQVKHLFLLVECMLYEVDVDLSLTTGCHTME